MCSLAWHTAFAIIAPTIKLYNKSIANRKPLQESGGFTSLQTLMEIEICFTCRALQVNCLGRLPCLSVCNILVFRDSAFNLERFLQVRGSGDSGQLVGGATSSPYIPLTCVFRLQGTCRRSSRST